MLGSTKPFPAGVASPPWPRVAAAPAAGGSRSGGPGLDDAAVALHLHRIGISRRQAPSAPTAAALRTLHRQHLVTVPYNNLAFCLGHDIVLDEAWLLNWIVDGGRGGTCVELNATFAALLRGLGYHVTLLAARVFTGRRLALPYSHIALRVEAEDGSAWLADVGFGKHSHHPLSLDEPGEQFEPGGRFQITETSEGDLDVLRDGVPRYRVESRPRELTDFEGTFWWLRTSPQSPYIHSPICSRLTEQGGRITLTGRDLVTTDAQGGRTRRELPEEGLLDAYRTHFGLTLERAPDAKRGALSWW